MQVRNMEVSIIGLPVGVIICDRPASRIFRPLRFFTLTGKASTMSSGANTVLSL